MFFLKLKYITIQFLFFSLLISAQVPSGYYELAENLADENLKEALHEIIKNHVQFPYTSSSTDTWNILTETDRDPNNADNVILIYSGVSVNAAQEYNNAKGWTREHVWAKSRGDFGTAPGAGTDVHALRPLDNTTNSKRSNRAFNNCTDCEEITDKWGNITGSKKDSDEWSFEPRDAVKGDVARMLFYMAVRYDGPTGELDLELTEDILSNTDKTPVHGVLSVLLEWHRNDPVDAWEENRNNIIYNSFQNNRNPFIDVPVLAEYLWGTAMGVNWTGQSLGLTKYEQPYISIYPNPANKVIYIKGLASVVSKIKIYAMNGRLLSTTDFGEFELERQIDISKLAAGVYFIKMDSTVIKLLKK
jgi:endonuclease I